MRIIVIVACIILLALIVGCASPPDRVLTAEQEAVFAKNCTAGCAVVPQGLWRKIIEALEQKGTGI